MTSVACSAWESDGDGVGTKRCQTCHQATPLDHFYPNRRHRDGLMKACKDCQSVKACTMCHVVKPLEAFYRRAQAADGHLGCCTACLRQRQKAFRAAHPAHVRQRDAKYRSAYAAQIPARRKAWRTRHPGKSQEYESKRRARKRRAGVIESIDRAYVYRRDRGRCSICGGTVRTRDMSIDHIVPLALGGQHTLTNVALVHRQCNTRKRTRAVPQQLHLLG